MARRNCHNVGCISGNINLPHPLGASDNPPFRLCERDTKPHAFTFAQQGNRYAYSGVFHERPRTRGLDVDVCLSGEIAVSRLKT